MSTQYYVEFDKPLDDYCEVRSLIMNYQGTPSAVGGVYKASAHSVSFKKDHDYMSAQLMQHCAMGTRFKTVWIEFYDNDKDYPYLTYVLTDVIIAGMQSGREDTLSLDCKKITHHN